MADKMTDTEWTKAHRHLQRIGTAFSDLSNILLDADIQRREGNLEAAAMLAGAARTLQRTNETTRLLYAQLNRRANSRKKVSP
jgi:hypothetical protein